ncbi:MAG: carbon storage regulator CsrA [Chloroflexi bacterium]|nr:carbon storage regulator CsrA [Chloroflexota bacterium]
MLVLTRRKDESLLIGDDIVVTILGIEGDKVKIGIAAPQEIPILREEVYQAVVAQNKIKERLEHGPEPEAFKELRRMLSEAEPPPDAKTEEQKSE